MHRTAIEIAHDRAEDRVDKAILLGLLAAWFMLLTLFLVDVRANALTPEFVDKRTYASASKNYTITAHSRDVTHVACEATRTFPDGVTLRLLQTSKGQLSATIAGVDFGISENTPGLIALDRAASTATVGKAFDEPLEVYGIHIGRGVTSIDLADVKTLTQELRSRYNVRIVFSDYRYDVDLSETSVVLGELRECNEAGQSRVNRRRISDALPARLVTG